MKIVVKKDKYGLLNPYRVQRGGGVLGLFSSGKYITLEEGRVALWGKYPISPKENSFRIVRKK